MRDSEWESKAFYVYTAILRIAKVLCKMHLINLNIILMRKSCNALHLYNLALLTSLNPAPIGSHLYLKD